MEKEKTELTLYNNIDKELRRENDVKVFPLTPTHRKELRELKEERLGSMRIRLSIIKSKKMDEYNIKYSKKLQKEVDEKESICDQLNNDWKDCILGIKIILQHRKDLENKSDTEFLNLEKDYDDICKLKISNPKRKYSINKKSVSKAILELEFNNKYGKQFEKIIEKIDEIETQYEEAINFGDLEIVKKLYYIIKGSDSFFKKIEEFEV